MADHTTNETLRKLLHIGFGLGALALRWLTWQEAVAICAIAVVGNWLVLHRVVGRSVSRDERGWDAGIVLYPAAVLVLVFIFRQSLVVAGTVWVIMAFGDGFATLAGRAFDGPRLPWNREKSWAGFIAFIIAAAPAAYGISRFLNPIGTYFHRAVIILVAVLAGAIAESLDTRVDDNITVPLASGMAMSLLFYSVHLPPMHGDRAAMIWLAVNAVLAVAGTLAKSVDLSGAIGGVALGAVIIIFGGWPLYAALLAFFILGTAATKLGYRRKEAVGLAQERGGRRGFRHAFANVGVAAILSLAIATFFQWDMLFVMALASLATAAADTVSSEIGQLIGRRAFLPLTFRAVPPGTEGAVSIEGTAAGVVAAAIVATVGVLASSHFGYWRLTDVVESGDMYFVFRPATIVLVTFCAAAGSYVESIIGSWNRKQRRHIPNGVLNFFNTAVGAALVPLLTGIASLL